MNRYVSGMTEPENLILALLRELRADIADVRAEIADVRAEMRERFGAVDKRLDAMHLNGVKALRGFIGHRAMVECTMASFEDESARLKRRVDELEASRAP